MCWVDCGWVWIGWVVDCCVVGGGRVGLGVLFWCVGSGGVWKWMCV